MKIEEILESRLLKVIILAFAGLIILVFVFGLGVFVGARKADFSFKWAQAYHTNFDGPQEGFLGNIMSRDFTAANGVFGKIVKISGQTITINGKDNIEKNILVDSETIINFQKKNKKIADLKVGDSVIVVGEPEANGQIKAELIRLMPIARP